MLKHVVRFVTRGPAYRIGLTMRWMFWLQHRGYRRLALWVSNRMQRKYGVFISPRATIGKGLILKHPIAIVIGEGVVLGDDVTLYQSVTLGGARSGDSLKQAYPQLGDKVTVFAGAVLIGAISIGENSIIGANAVVNKSFPANSVVAGVPAKEVGRSTEHQSPRGKE